MMEKKTDEKKKNSKEGSIPETDPGSANITVIGVGGCGRYAVNRMIDSEMSDVCFISMDTNAEELEQKSKASGGDIKKLTKVFPDLWD